MLRYINHALSFQSAETLRTMGSPKRRNPQPEGERSNYLEDYEEGELRGSGLGKERWIGGRPENGTHHHSSDRGGEGNDHHFDPGTPPGISCSPSYLRGHVRTPYTRIFQVADHCAPGALLKDGGLRSSDAKSVSEKASRGRRPRQPPHPQPAHRHVDKRPRALGKNL